MRIIRTLQVLIIAAMLLIPWKVEAGGPKTVWVRPYTKSNGSSVSGHWRSPPDYGASLSPLSPLISSSVGSTCYIPDYSMFESGRAKFGERMVTSKEGLDLSKCAIGTRGGAGDCEGFSIAVNGATPRLDESYHFKSLAAVCVPSDLSNLPGGASVVCQGGGVWGSRPDFNWTLTIIPEQICTDPETLPPAK